MGIAPVGIGKEPVPDGLPEGLPDGIADGKHGDPFGGRGKPVAPGNGKPVPGSPGPPPCLGKMFIILWSESGEAFGRKGTAARGARP